MSTRRTAKKSGTQSRSSARLRAYQSKRDFTITPEPAAPTSARTPSRAAKALHYYVQRHAARRLHYDFRLELNGTLRSWAVPKGPNLDPAQKRLAMQTEDHPLEYGEFEGVIPEKQYGAGEVVLWDRGVWRSEDDDPEAALRAGRLSFTLDGEKLRGRWRLIRTGRGEKEDGRAWLLIKSRDAEARAGDAAEITALRPESVKRRRKTASHAATADTAAKAVADTAAAATAPAAAHAPTRGRTRSSAAPTRVAGITITHPERLIWPTLGISKLDLARYYESVGPQIVRELQGRPLALVRCPAGSDAECFFQKHMRQGRPAAVKQGVWERAARGKEPSSYLFVRDLAGVISMVQNGAVELHAWGAREPLIERPDRFTLDLDPDPALPFERLVEAAHLTRALLDELGLQSFLKTTGGKGLHVIVALARRHAWDEVKEFTRRVAAHLARSFPDRFTASMAKARRPGRIFIDYLRNAEGATAIAAYSARARPGAPVATPIAWEELSIDVRGACFNVRNLPERAANSDDPWRDFGRVEHRITRALLDKLPR